MVKVAALFLIFAGTAGKLLSFATSSAQPEDRNKADLETFFLRTIEFKTEEEARSLIENTKNENVTDRAGFSAMHLAALRGWDKIIQLLINKGYTRLIHQQNEVGRTPLHLRAQYGYPKVVNLLIEFRSNVKERDSTGWTPLHFAALNGNVDVVNLLIENGAKVDEKNDDGLTSLHVAVANGRKEVVEVLVCNGANVNAEDENNKKPRDLAGACQDIVQWIDRVPENVHEWKVCDKRFFTTMRSMTREKSPNDINASPSGSSDDAFWETTTEIISIKSNENDQSVIRVVIIVVPVVVAINIMMIAFWFILRKKCCCVRNGTVERYEESYMEPKSETDAYEAMYVDPNVIEMQEIEENKQIDRILYVPVMHNVPRFQYDNLENRRNMQPNTRLQQRYPDFQMRNQNKFY